MQLVINNADCTGHRRVTEGAAVSSTLPNCIGRFSDFFLLQRVLRLVALQAEMLQTLKSFHLRLEAILQHRRLELLGSYGFLKRDFNATNYSIRSKIPKAASTALGFKRKITWHTPSKRRLPATKSSRTLAACFR